MALRLRGSTSGYAEIDAPAVAGDVTLTLPSTTGTINVKDASGNTEVGTGVTFGNPGANIFTVNNTGGERLRIAADGTVSIPGALNVSGVLTYEDVTSVDAIGLSTFRDGLNTKDVGITTISTSVSDTAVDVFIYDTSKDSDGGEWRKRTTHTSWYNETLNTATRGSRREFPAVAVIVVETRTMTIYDGDDPDLPMWMVFNKNTPANGVNTGNLVQGYGPDRNFSCVTAKNGSIVPGESQASAGVLYIISMIADNSDWVSESDAYGGFYNGNIAQRHDGLGYSVYAQIGAGERTIVSMPVNDVAMTVLPNAPIDDATGLPVPTIAVATNGGVSVIKDDGTVVDGFTSTTILTGFIGIDEKSNKILYAADNTTKYKWIYYFDIPNADNTGNSYLISPNSIIADYNHNADFASYSAIPLDSDNDGQVDAVSFEPNKISVGTDNKLAIVHFDEDGKYATQKGLMCGITTNYNTGWQNWNIKGAFLSDTDTNNVTGTELVTNGTFDSDTSNWTANGATLPTLSVNSSRLQITHNGANGGAYQNITTVVGETYTLSADLTNNTATHIRLRVYGDGSTGDGFQGTVYTGDNVTATSSTSTSITFVAETTTTRIYIEITGTNAENAFADNVAVRIADLDRSVNRNGLQVFGTVTKTAVATGAELVGYSGFTGSDYLFQPHNPDISFGASDDFSIILWVNGSNITGSNNIVDWGNGSDNTNRWVIYETGGNYLFYDAGTARASSIAATSEWKQLAFVRQSGVLSIYGNGVLNATHTVTSSYDNTDCDLYIGTRHTLEDSWEGSIALLRISATVPSAEQIKKIYEDEKVLFQENAACTLYGTSDAVTALAYDEVTEQLHVGTSSGRSDFQGLRRINNTTQEVQTAISAHDTFIIEQ